MRGYHSKLMMTPPPPKGRPRGGSVTKKDLKNLPDPPCLGEALRRVSSKIYSMMSGKIK
jgi:hypothetical protein